MGFYFDKQARFTGSYLERGTFNTIKFSYLNSHNIFYPTFYVYVAAVGAPINI